MSRPPIKPVDDKLRIVLAVLRGEVSMKEVARRERVSETSIAAWRDQFLDGGRAALAAGTRHGPSVREAELQAQVEELTSALGEAHVELWRAPSRIPATSCMNALCTLRVVAQEFVPEGDGGHALFWARRPADRPD